MKSSATLMSVLLSFASATAFANEDPPVRVGLADIAGVDVLGLRIDGSVTQANVEMEKLGYHWEPQPLSGRGRVIQMATGFVPVINGNCRHRYLWEQGNESREVVVVCNSGSQKVISLFFRTTIRTTGVNANDLALEASPYFEDTARYFTRFCGPGWRNPDRKFRQVVYTPPNQFSRHSCGGAKNLADLDVIRHDGVETAREIKVYSSVDRDGIRYSIGVNRSNVH